MYATALLMKPAMGSPAGRRPTGSSLAPGCQIFGRQKCQAFHPALTVRDDRSQQFRGGKPTLALVGSATMGFRLGYKRGVPERPNGLRAERGIMRVLYLSVPYCTPYRRTRNAAGASPW